MKPFFIFDRVYSHGLNDVSFSIDENEVVHIYGSQDLFKIINRSCPIQKGQITIPHYEKTFYRQTFGYISFQYPLLEGSVKKNIDLTCKIHHVKSNYDGIEDVLYKKVKHLSESEYQKVLIHRALCTHPSFILMEDIYEEIPIRPLLIQEREWRPETGRWIRFEHGYIVEDVHHA